MRMRMDGREWKKRERVVGMAVACQLCVPGDGPTAVSQAVLVAHHCA